MGYCEHCHKNGLRVTLSNGDELLCNDCMNKHNAADAAKYNYNTPTVERIDL